MSCITYDLSLNNQETYYFVIDLDRPDPSRQNGEANYPFWTELSHRQCSSCPLDTSTHKYCPPAVDIQHIAEKFINILSTEKVDVKVKTDQRTYFKTCDAQQALRSLYGLIMASSSCPTLSRLKPLARSHLPFASIDETINRLVGSYLIKQRYLYMNEGEPDWNLSGITKLYEDLEIVNTQLMNRLRDASTEDANYNAICVFVSFSMVLNMGIDDMLESTNDMLKSGF